MNNICFYKSPVGAVLKIADDGVNIKEITFAHNACGCCLNAIESRLGHIAKKQLAEYFAGERKSFELPIAPDGTEFGRRFVIFRTVSLEATRRLPKRQDVQKAFAQSAEQITGTL